ncbi:ABC transporter ATP-binding protein [Micromonospora sagamiensis]|uniref:ABC-2 type transport system ATP-binding protein n=1 Tax=Micromonospora sagamiensis TaxID=47875 RepID=A0A562WJ25_9ACTN|nr:ABC transporter ATP-binding protein [Micromonospora sagamiensis]TWJ30299.1 ABC-2 type transport system ATP-binding protein [Micromonospora sagamiensis]BCL16671.1 daunorubicin resistance protein DrrA family ABC transporter ATP-binding protein [Micromonospora sagamiensis]
MATNDIEVDELVRDYRRGGSTLRAVDSVSFSVARGELFGILGPNGAGKTTTIKVLLTTLLPTSGRVSVLGHDVTTHVKQVRRRVGHVLGGDKGFYDRLTARQNLTYFADLYEVPHRVQRTRIPELLEQVGLSERSRDRVEVYSRGMKQRLHIARSLVHDPQVLILDEPTNGIDPVGARELRELTAGLTRQGKTVLLTTHYMHEAEAMCERLVVLARGRIIASGTPSTVKRAVGIPRVTEIEVDGLEPERIAAIRGLAGVTSVEVDAVDARQLIQVRTEPDADCLQAVIQALGRVRIGRITTHDPTLEDAYVALVSRAPRDAS